MAKLEIPKQTSYPSELAFQVDIENFLRNEKFRVFSIRDSRRVTMPGWPDIFAWRGNKIIAVELKMPKNKLTADQITGIESSGFSIWLDLYRSAARIAIDGSVVQEAGASPTP